MKIVNLIQGQPEWHAHRAQHNNASDAPAMMGCSPYKTRAQLLREVATGIAQEVDAATQRRFDDGHRFEELARPLAEQIIGEELFPVTGTDGKLSASFDGLTMAGDTAFEHKSLNDKLRTAMVYGCTGADLPLHYQVQMEQQLLVSGAERVLFMASKWNGEGLVEERHCWYVSNAELRAAIAAGWKQFEADVAAYEPEAAAPTPVVAVVAGFGNLSVRVEGRVLASNLDAFKADAEAFIASLPKPAALQSDQDFAEAEAAVKACADAEARIKAVKETAMGEMADVDAMFRTADAVNEALRQARLALDKAVKAEKENRKGEIVQAGAAAVRAHIAGVNASLGEHAISPPANLVAELGLAIKGKKSLDSMRDAVSTAVAAQKIAASQFADGIRASIAVLAEFPDHAHLFADRVQLCASKTPEDLRNLAKTRIAAYEQREADKLEAEREKIRAEEAAKLQREQAPQASSSTTVQHQRVVESAPVSRPAAVVSASPGTTTGKRIKLGDINAAISPLSITADGLAKLGFKHVAQDRNAKLYDSSQLQAIFFAMRTVLVTAEKNGPLATLEQAA
ncbi:YqaJ-like viral recombinase domain protein [compost metagenome]